MRRSVFSALVIVSLTLGMLNLFVEGVPEGRFNPSASGISLTLDFGNSTIQEFYNLEGNNVYEVTNSTTSVEGDWFGDLVYVYSISGVSEHDITDLYWQYWVNGVRASIAANKYILQDGDSVEWKLSSQLTDTNTSPSPDIDYSLVIGTGLLGIVMIPVLVILWFNNKEVGL